MELVSVVISAYNSAPYLPEAVRSALRQTYRKLEIIVVDDGSTDDTSEVLRPFKHRIKYVYQEHSGAPARPRNAGIRHSQGRYVAIFDSDDVMVPTKIENQVTFLAANARTPLVFSDFYTMKEGKSSANTFLRDYEFFQRAPTVYKGKSRFILEQRTAYEMLMIGNYIGTSSVMMDKELFLRIGGFDEKLQNSDDFDLWCRVASQYDLGFIDQPLHWYRACPNSVSSRPYRARSRLLVLERQRGHAMSRRARQALRQRMSNNLFGLGYEEFGRRRRLSALQYYVRSARMHFTVKPLCAIAKVLIACVLPEGAIARIRKAISL